jgi:nicotinate-nucleotide adenylyltransferase
VKEAHGLDQVFIIPTNRSPHKQQSVPVEAKHRLNMLKRAFRDLPWCQVLPLEIMRGGTSYTIDTIRELKAKGYVSAKDSLYLLLGEDNVANFGSWKEVDALMAETRPLVASRKNAQPFPKTAVGKWLKKGVSETPYFEVSSTEIRKRVKKKLYCGHLLNNLVYNYIQRNNLYD